MKNGNPYALGVLAALVLAPACMERELTDVLPQVQSGTRQVFHPGGMDDVDLLVLVDNSNSMREEQASLALNLPPMIRALTDPPDEDGDGFPDYPPVSTLHVGVISSDMGTGGYPVSTCDQSERGDDGVLRNLPSPAVEGCDAAYPKYLSYDRENPDPDIDKDFECIATLGTSGCGFEQQLAAIEKAATVHAPDGAANEGFLRSDALLAILVVTDEEDCSVADPRIFGDDDTLGPLNLRCFNNPEMVRPIDEFVGSILALRPGRPDTIVVAGIVGVPPDLIALSADDLASDDIQSYEDFEDILDDPRMQEVVDYSPEGGGSQLIPSCNVPGLGKAFPPRRIVQWIRDIDREGNNGIVQSICQADWGPTMRAITKLIADKLRGACLPRPLTDSNGGALETGEHADCIVRETLDDSRDCGPGRFRVDTTEEGHTVCQVCQQGDGEGPYVRDQLGNDLGACAGSSENWFYTTEDERCEGAKVEFTEGAIPEEDSELLLECLTTVAAS